MRLNLIINTFYEVERNLGGQATRGTSRAHQRNRKRLAFDPPAAALSLLVSLNDLIQCTHRRAPQVSISRLLVRVRDGQQVCFTE